MQEDIQLSEYFDVKSTRHSGRTCFANQDLKKGMTVLQLQRAIGSTICYGFRKEVCHYCFHYDHGKTMKIRVNSEQAEKLGMKVHRTFTGAGMWFCNELCRDEFLSTKHISDLLEVFEAISSSLQRCKRNKKVMVEEGTVDGGDIITSSSIERAWDKVEKKWIPQINGVKLPARLEAMKVVLDEEHYSCARFVAECLFKLKHMERDSPMYKSFMNLQSNELQKICEFPVLLKFQTEVYMFLYVTLPENLKSLMTRELFRKILGSEYGNSFGIWQENEAFDNREYLGYWMLPEGSFFNHSCAPNLSKKRIGNVMNFVLNKDVKMGDELCIDYKGILDLPIHQRRKILKTNWFFECQCSRCSLELQSIH
ncbi:Set6p Ecym_2380 [Eremothecium cymbalariae DBVPG|uniref:SET domain-containing protein n=1 Tax=Eremothecium cymbalariae (strain CBS 270.75 / DBVPG 7215 / KCTC 17166 / NRRL Y-17582) TaxID=931890 RepID=G8JNP5_ERECY|nr:Hypothetical protein Ecym_2380 [Eremothecium cymbalariae DBVPG\